MPKTLPIEKTIEEVERYLAKKDDKRLEDAFQRLCGDFNDIKDVTDEPYAVYVQFKAMATLVRCHIYAGNTDDMMELEWEMIGAFYMLTDSDILSSTQIHAILRLLKNTIGEVNDYYYQTQGISFPTFTVEKTERPAKNSPIVRKEIPSHDCLLCQSKIATCKGSHLAPNFLIQPFFAYDGSTTRGKELVKESVLGGMQHEIKWGRSVPPEIIDEKFGIVDDEEKTTIKLDALTRDDVFCNRCEHRFAYIETAYSHYFPGHEEKIPPPVSYLLWLGIFWRLSVADMCFWLSKTDAENARAILDSYMPDEQKAVTSIQPDAGMGKFGYTILHCSNLKGELSGLVGNHARQSPYKLIVGKYIVILYGDKEKAPADYPVSDYTTRVQVVEISFIEYWKHKRDILDTAQRIESKNISRSKRQLTDLVQADHVKESSSLFRKEDENAIYEQVIERKANYGYTIPGSIQKIMLYNEQHPFDTYEERLKGIEDSLGYTPDEVDEMLNYLTKSGIYRVSSAERTEMHNKKKQRSKQKQAQAKRKQKKRKRKN